MSLFLAAVIAFTTFLAGFTLCSLLSMNRVDELDAGKNYLRNLFNFVAPQCIPGDSLVDLVMQIDNYIAGRDIETKNLCEKIMKLEQEKYSA
jgi:hypothetical protein